MSISILMASSLQWRCQCRALLYFLLLPQRWRSATQPLWSEQQEQQARRAEQVALARLAESEIQARAVSLVQAECPEARAASVVPAGSAARARLAESD